MENLVLLSRDDLAEAIYNGISRYMSTCQAEMQGEDKHESHDEYLSSTEVCKRLRISYSTLWRYESSGMITPIKIGRKKIYPQVQIVQLVEKQQLNITSNAK